MRLLFIAPRLPFPADTGGKIRTLNILRQLTKECRIDLVCFSFEKDDRTFLNKFEEMNVSVTLVKAKSDNFLKMAQTVLTSGRPHSIEKYDSSEMRNAIILLVQQNDYDIVHVDHIHMACYISSLGSIPSIIDEHNVEYEILKRCALNEKNFTKQLIFRQQARKMKYFEKNLIEQCTAVTAVSAADADILQNLTDNKVPIHVIPNGVSTQYFFSERSHAASREESVVFTGSMDWLPNDDAARYFCQDILPLIWKVKPQIRFYIIGKGPSRELCKFGQTDKRIIVAGRVDDVRPFVSQAKVFVVPLRIGGGTRLKILESMSMKKTVVSTSIGAEGIKYVDGKNIIIADKPQDFADSVISLIDDDPKRSSLEEEGRKLVLEKYDWPIIGNKLLSVYKRINNDRKI